MVAMARKSPGKNCRYMTTRNSELAEKFPQLQKNDALPSHLNKHPVYPQLLFRDGTSPGEVVQMEPSLRTCMANFGRYEYGLIAATTVIPAYIGYSGSRSIKSFPFVVGLSAGLLSGLCYAYAYSYSQLSGFIGKVQDKRQEE